MKHADLKYLEELSNGSKEFVAEMISLFMEQTPEALEKIKLHMQSGDWQLLRDVLHKMKPSVSFMGLKEIESVVKEAEEFAESETNLDRLPGMVDTIQRVCGEAMTELQSELKRFS